jgi:hypothetical protein
MQPGASGAGSLLTRRWCVFIPPYEGGFRKMFWQNWLL